MSEQELKESKQNSSKHKLPILAVDYGEKRFGIAISDIKGLVGSSLTTIEKTKRRGVEGVIEDILGLVNEHKAGSIMVGLPQEFENSYKATSEKILSFGDKLSEETELEVWYYDESYSSEAAQKILPQTEKRARSKGSIDRMSAALFLQEYLNENNST